MSFFKKLGRKAGGRLSSKVDAKSLDIQEGAHEKAVPTDQDKRSGGASNGRRGDKTPGEGSIHSSTPAQTVNISGGTFNEVQNQYIINAESDNKLFATLNPIPAAHDCQEVASKVTECFAGTRRQLLLDIEKWRTTESSVPIFILDGIAGIGKTTVVKTICARAAADHRLAASWFFSRDQQDRKSTRAFVGTLAFQLSKYHPSFRDRIAQALKDQPDILQKTIRAQFDTLVDEPLQAMLTEVVGTHTISIDAIDECDLNEATEILSILLTMIPKHPQIRLLITCRPERPFRLLLQKHRGPHVFHLHEIENSVVEADIRLYINYRLSPEQVDEALPDLLPPPWRVSATEKEALVQMAGKLFIVASTAVDFILDPKQLDPERQIQHLLDTTTGAGLASSPMDRLYTQVLRAAVPNPVGDWFDSYKVVVGAIVAVADVLPVQSLASLVDKGPNDIVRALSHLHSLIAPTNRDEAFRVHHKSFPDFVTDPTRCSIDTRFLIDAPAAHFHLARGCLRVMVQTLKQNICDLPLSDWSKELSELPPGTITADRISPELAYACSHWISHFRHGIFYFNGSEGAAFADQLNTFVNEHLLSWLEVVALMGRFDTAWNSINGLLVEISLACSTATGKSGKILSHVVDVLEDCLRFITLHCNLPRLCPMHIYLSSLPFVPRDSIMSKLYARCLPKESVGVSVGIDRSWDPVAVGFRSNFDTEDLTFSPCSTMVAISSDVLRLYNVKSGGQVQQFSDPEGVGRWHGHIAFSPDGRFISAGSKTWVYIWNIASGELKVKFPIPSETSPTSITFTGDGTSIVAGTWDGTVFVWMLEGESLPKHVLQTRKPNDACRCSLGKFLRTCKAHVVRDLISLPSSSGLIVVTASEVECWDLFPPDILATILRHVDGTHTCHISLSLDKSMLAMECDPAVVSVYSTNQPRRIAVLSGHQGLITTLAFSPDPEELCSASQDMTVRIWHISTSTQLRVISTAPGILTDATFAKSIGKFIFRNEDRMVKLSDNGCVAFGPEIRRDKPCHSIRLSSSAMAIAIMTGNYTALSSLNYLAEAPSFDLNRFIYKIGFFPTGELVTICNKGLGLIEVVISNLDGDGQELGSTSFNIMDIDPDAISVTSPDMTRVMVTGPSSSVSVYNLYSQTLEAFLEPLPDSRQPWICFSWDSSTVYAERREGSDLSRSFYAAILQPSTNRIRLPGEDTPAPVAMSKSEHGPNPSWRHLRVTRAPAAHQLHFLSGDRPRFLQHSRSWNQISPSALPTRIEAMSYSPNCSLVAVIGGAKDDDYGEPRVIQVRCLPDYNLVGTLDNDRHASATKILFLPSLPHVLVARSPLGLTSWDTTTLETLGDFSFKDPSITLLRVHPYNAYDFVCLIHKTALESTAGLAAVRLQGSLPAKFSQICWFPPHLSIEDRCLEVDPCHPHLIALEGRNGPLVVDISKFPLPFTL